MQHPMHMSYITAARGLFVLLLVDILFAIVSLAVPELQQVYIGTVFLLLIPLIFSASLIVVILCLFVPQHHRLSNLRALKLSVLNILCSFLLFTAILVFY